MIYNNEFELFKKSVKPTDNIDLLLSISISDYHDEFAKFIMSNFNKYKEAGQMALEASNIPILKIYIEKMGYNNLIINKYVLRLINSIAKDNNYTLLDYLLDNTMLLSKKHLTQIICSFIKNDIDNNKITYFIDKIKNNIDLTKLKNCALNAGNVDIINFLINKGTKPIKQKLIDEKIIEKNKRNFKKKVDRWIAEWIHNSRDVDKNLSPEFISVLKDTVKDSNYTIYRGLTWGKKYIDNDNTIDINDLKINNKLNLVLNNFTSWSTNYKVAEFYSKNKVLSTANDYGLILKLNIDKSHILADLRDSDFGDFTTHFYTDEDGDKVFSVFNQSEIILEPGKYECEIILIRILDYIIT